MKTVMAFGAHPDDIEISCGGTLIKLKEQGHKVICCDLVRGELGTRGSAEIREEECKEASKIMGIDARENLGIKDGFISDCRRDYGNALKLGMAAEKVAFDFPIPVTGGVALGNVPLAGLAQRKVILVPKAYEGLANKTLPIIEAFRLCENELKGYEIHLYMRDPDVRSYWHQMPEWLRKMGHCHGAVPKQELIQAMGQARVMIATSISEGTPNVMLEAMAAGAFPIMSPIDSVLEWIEDGKNGLLAHALFPNQIADSLKRALQDDALLEQAMQPNRALVAERADRERIRPAVIEYYRRLAGA